MGLLIFQLHIIYLTESNINEERERDKINSLNKQSKMESMQASTPVVCISNVDDKCCCFNASHHKVC